MRRKSQGRRRSAGLVGDERLVGLSFASGGDSSPMSVDARQHFPGLRDSVVDGDVEGVRRWMLAHNSRISVADENGWTALHFAAANNRHGTMIDLLVRSRLPVNKLTANHWSPLHFAAYNNHQGVVDQLLRSGADPSVVDDAGSTPDELAALCGNNTISYHLSAFLGKRKVPPAPSPAVSPRAEPESKHEVQRQAKLKRDAQKRRLEARQRQLVLEYDRKHRAVMIQHLVGWAEIELEQLQNRALMCLEITGNLAATERECIRCATAWPHEVSVPEPCGDPFVGAVSPVSGKPRSSFGASVGKRRRRRSRVTKSLLGSQVQEMPVIVEPVQVTSEEIRLKTEQEAAAARARIEAWLRTAEVTHTGAYTDGVWSCCGSYVECGDGCVIAPDVSRPLIHFGEYRFHIEGCRCAEERIPRSTVSFNQPAELTPRGLHALRLRNKGRYCTPAGSCWDCCGSQNKGAEGCYGQKVYLQTCPEVIQPAAVPVFGSRFNANIATDGSCVELGAKQFVGILTVACDPLFTSRGGYASYAYEVLVEHCSPHEHLTIGVVTDQWFSFHKGDANSSFIGGMHGLAWWSNTHLVSGMGRRVTTLDNKGTPLTYSQGDVVGVVVDLLNKEVVFFVNRLMAAVVPVPAVLGCIAVRPAVSLHSGARVSFRPSIATAPASLRSTVREREKWFSDWANTRYRGAKEERDRRLAEENAFSRALPVLQ